MQMNKPQNRTNEISSNRYGTKMKIIDYQDSHNVLIEFQDEHRFQKWCFYNVFLKGEVLNPYDKSYYGVGCLGEINASEHNKAYSVWRFILKRCYKNNNIDLRAKSYLNCTVSDEWLTFKNFCAWYEANYYPIGNEKMCVDKDILIKNNKIYSKETCLIVPNRINMLFAKCKGNRGNTVIGVSYDKRSGKYRVSASDLINNKPKGLFDTEIEAFLAYKTCKEEYIKEIADQYKNKIPSKLYNAMYMYQVDMDD
jgi:hypothetical protein